MTLIHLLIIFGSLAFLFLMVDLWRNGSYYWCKTFHRRHHDLQPSGYGSRYVVHCRKCREHFAQYRA